MCPPISSHWRHLANTIELLHPSAHLSPQSKRQIDRFSRFCTAACRVSLYFTMVRPFLPQNCPFPWGWGSGPHVIHASLGPAESSTQTATRSRQPFLQGSLVRQTDRLRRWVLSVFGLCRLQTTLLVGNNGPHTYIHLSLIHI